MKTKTFLGNDGYLYHNFFFIVDMFLTHHILAHPNVTHLDKLLHACQTV